MVTKDITWLIIEGITPLPVLAEAWELIIEEYASLVKTEKSNDIFDLYKKIKQTQWQMEWIEKTIDALKIQYDEEMAIWLGERGFGVVEYSDDRETYLRSLFSIKNGSKTLIVLLNQYNAEYKALSKDHDQQNDSGMSESEMRFTYEKEIALLSRFQHDTIIKQNISVFQYAAIQNNYLLFHKVNKPTTEDV